MNIGGLLVVLCILAGATAYVVFGDHCPEGKRAQWENLKLQCIDPDKEPASSPEAPSGSLDRVPSKLDVKLRGMRPLVGKRGCIMTYEILEVHPEAMLLEAFAIKEDTGNVIDSTVSLPGPFAPGTLIEFSFTEARCNDGWGLKIQAR